MKKDRTAGSEDGWVTFNGTGPGFSFTFKCPREHLKEGDNKCFVLFFKSEIKNCF